jgi:serine/threonine protein kinase
MAPLAYKVGTKGDVVGDEAQEVMEQESALMMELSQQSNPNILKGGARTGTANRGGYVMEQAGHGDLTSVFKKMQSQDPGKQMSEEDRLLVMRYLMRGGFRGLEEVHDKGYYHGDIKGQNFLLGDDLEPLLMDFGTTKKESNNKDDRVKQVGTATNMAPEVVSQGAVKKSDIWSMGETILQGHFGMDSVDVYNGKKTDDFGKDNLRSQFTAKDWGEKLDKKVETLKNAPDFKDFMGKIMKMDPDDRMSAKECLQHNFLKLTKGDEAKAKQLLKKVIS